MLSDPRISHISKALSFAASHFKPACLVFSFPPSPRQYVLWLVEGADAVLNLLKVTEQAESISRYRQLWCSLQSICRTSVDILFEPTERERAIYNACSLARPS